MFDGAEFVHVSDVAGLVADMPGRRSKLTIDEHPDVVAAVRGRTSS